MDDPYEDSAPISANLAPQRAERKLLFLARHLAQHCGAQPAEAHACACLAPNCVDVTCITFWATLLKRFTAEDWARMVRAYLAARADRAPFGMIVGVDVGEGRDYSVRPEDLSIREGEVPFDA